MLKKDTDSINSRDLEVINQLDDCFSVGVRRVTVPHLHTHTVRGEAAGLTVPRCCS